MSALLHRCPAPPSPRRNHPSPTPRFLRRTRAFAPRPLALAATILVAAAGSELPAAPAPAALNIRVGTLVPHGTSYHRNLLTMGDKWRQLSTGSVRITVFPGGTQGGDSEMVGLMQTGNLDAALLTAVGLSEIEKGVTALQSMPMSFRSLAEVDYVGDKLRPQLEARLLAKGYVVLFWTDSGWVRFFSKRPVVRPDDLRKLKVFCWAGEIHQFDLWKAARFQPVALESTAIHQGLMSGTISAVPMPPFFALAGSLDAHAKHMLELNWAPLIGAMVVRQATWERVPTALREKFLAIAREAGSQIKADGRAESDRSVAAMVKRGLQVHPVSAEIEAEWRDNIEQLSHQIRGRIVPAEMFDEAQRLLKEFRANQGAGKS